VQETPLEDVNGMVKNSHLLETKSRIDSGDAKIGIIGLGYVGLPLAVAFCEKYVVFGYDSDEDKCKMLTKGKSYIDDIPDSSIKNLIGKRLKVISRESKLKECDAVIICVPTPLDVRGIPDLSYIAHSADIIRRVAGKGMLVVLESTSYPGTTEEYLGHAIKGVGLVPGVDVALAFSPERVDPGNKKFGIKNTPKVVGGVNEESTELAASLYGSIVEAGVVKVRDCKTAEATKIVENIFRGVNIALINELALIFEKMGIDTWEVVRAASTKPFAFMPHYPGPGVGGHCIPLDPLYLSYKAKQYGIVPRFIELSREVNEFMKNHTINLVMAAMDEAGMEPLDATVAVMGIAYKKNISDTRESPAAEIIEELSKRVGKVLVHDPLAKNIHTHRGDFKTSTMKTIMGDADCLVFVADHDEYIVQFPGAFKGSKAKVVIDTRNMFDAEILRRMGIKYRCIGK